VSIENARNHVALVVTDQTVADGLPSSFRAASFLEMVGVALALAVFIGVQLALCHPAVIFNRALWADETLTAALVQDPSLKHALQAIAGGVETHPPVFDLLDRGFLALTRLVYHGSVRVVLRGFSTLCIWLALAGVYGLLRKTVRPGPALIGVLMVWVQPEIFYQIANARYYAPLLLATVWVCGAVCLPGQGAGRALLLAAAAVLLCTLHYFGIIMLGVIGLVMLWMDEGTVRQRFWRLLPALAGVVALALFLPCIKSQSAGVGAKTWIAPFTLDRAKAFLRELFVPLSLVALLLVWATAHLANRTKPRDSALPGTAGGRSALAVLLAMVLIPFILVVFSALVQSVLQTRYAVATVLWTAPLAALLSLSLSPRQLLVLGLVLAGLGFAQMFAWSRYLTQKQTLLRETCLDLRQEQPALPIVFGSSGDGTETLDWAPDLFARSYFVQLPPPLTDRQTWEADTLRKVRRFYPQPASADTERLRALGRFHLLSNESILPDLLAKIPLHHLNGTIYEVAAPDATAPSPN